MNYGSELSEHVKFYSNGMIELERKTELLASQMLEATISMDEILPMLNSCTWQLKYLDPEDQLSHFVTKSQSDVTDHYRVIFESLRHAHRLFYVLWLKNYLSKDQLNPYGASIQFLRKLKPSDLAKKLLSASG